MNPHLLWNTLQAHLLEWRFGVDGSTRLYWDHWADGIYHEYREMAQEAVRDDAVKLHRYAAHLRSSQIFAFNLFLPLRAWESGSAVAPNE